MTKPRGRSVHVARGGERRERMPQIKGGSGQGDVWAKFRSLFILGALDPLKEGEHSKLNGTGSY